MKFIILLIMLITLLCNTAAYAADAELRMEPMSAEDVESFSANLEIAVLETEPPKKAIECFDVSPNQQIAVGCESSDKKTVSIYDNEGGFCYGYRFRSSGAIGVVFQNEDLLIYLVRSSIAFSVDKSGNVQVAYRIPKAEANNEYWKESSTRTERTVGDTQYILDNTDILTTCSPSYSRLLAFRSDGGECVIYDASASHRTQMVTALLYICAVSGIVVYTMPKWFAAAKKKKEADDQ